MIVNIEVVKSCNDWNSFKEIVTKHYLKKVAATTVEHFKCFAGKKIQLSLLLTDDAYIKDLNFKFRNINKSTNVLSFPDDQINYQDIENIAWPSLIYLGDIAFSINTLIKEAEMFDFSILDHFTHLFVHSILHLLGFDHENDTDADAMESFEINILQSLNIPNPYLNKHYQL